MKDFHKGDRVQIRYTLWAPVGVTGEMWKYDGAVMEISRAKQLGKYDICYELEGAVSDRGMHFTFAPDWLRKAVNEE